MKTKLTIYTLSLMIFIGCEKFVEIDAPQNQLLTSNVFSNDESATSAAAGLYISMVDKGSMPYSAASYAGLLSDELNNFAAANVTLYTNALRSLDAPTNNVWINIYSIIYQANSIISGCEASVTLSPAVKQQLIAEAKFSRAFWYFYLVNLWGEVPLVTSTGYNDVATAPKTPTVAVYEQIVKDLKDAEADLNANYVGANAVTISTERLRPNKGAAAAMLSRTYLYLKNWAEAEKFASQVIQNKTLYDTVNVKETFLKGTKEAIWQLMKPLPNNNINTHEGKNFILTARPSNTGFNSATISSQLLGTFETGDKRKTEWINKFTDKTVTPNVDYLFPYKYKVQSAAAVSEHSIVFRLGEVYLIRAESRVNLGDLAGAIADIDVLRKRAGLPLLKDINPGISKEDLLNRILKERQVELFTEWGHRWLDLKRTGRVDAVMSVICPLKGGVWKTEFQLLPIPRKEIENNPKIIQNPGYN